MYMAVDKKCTLKGEGNCYEFMQNPLLEELISNFSSACVLVFAIKSRGIAPVLRNGSPLRGVRKPGIDLQ